MGPDPQRLPILGDVSRRKCLCLLMYSECGLCWFSRIPCHIPRGIEETKKDRRFSGGQRSFLWSPGIAAFAATVDGFPGANEAPCPVDAAGAGGDGGGAALGTAELVGVTARQVWIFAGIKCFRDLLRKYHIDRKSGRSIISNMSSILNLQHDAIYKTVLGLFGVWVVNGIFLNELQNIRKVIRYAINLAICGVYSQFR